MLNPIISKRPRVFDVGCWLIDAAIENENKPFNGNNETHKASVYTVKGAIKFRQRNNFQPLKSKWMFEASEVVKKRRGEKGEDFKKHLDWTI